MGLLMVAACGGSAQRQPADAAAELAETRADAGDAPMPSDKLPDTSDAAVPSDVPAGEAAIDERRAIDLQSVCPSAEDPGEPVAVPARSGQLPPRRWILGPWYGTLCGWSYDPTAVACSPGITSAGEQALASLAGFARYDIPITALHFDGDGWSKWHADPSSSNECAPAFGSSVVDALRAANVRALLHYWGHCVFAGDFARAYQVLGGTLGGFYLDDGAGTLVTSNVNDWLATNVPGDGELVSKRFPYPDSWTPWGDGYGAIPDAWNQLHAHSAYVNDLTHDWAGMAEGIRRVFDGAAVLPAPFNEFLGFQSFPNPGEGPPTLGQYYRRLHFGAMQVVMDNSPYENLDPWRPEWDVRLIAAYRYYAWLHYELVPYLHSYDREAYELGTPIFRSADPDHFSTMLGNELFVNYVVGDGITKLAVAFPPGEWLDYWDPSQVYAGPAEYQVPVGTVPPSPDSKLVTGREPIFIRRGAIIPMDVRRDYTGHGTRESEGSLTVVVFPATAGAFRYFDASSRWVTFTATVDGDRLTLARSRAVTQPQIYRVEGWPKRPRSIATCGSAIVVNGDGDGGLSEVTSESAANGATQGSWFYDASARRLIVKVFERDDPGP
jgi:hypothetical protein